MSFRNFDHFKLLSPAKLFRCPKLFFKNSKSLCNHYKSNFKHLDFCIRPCSLNNDQISILCVSLRFKKKNLFHS